MNTGFAGRLYGLNVERYCYRWLCKTHPGSAGPKHPILGAGAVAGAMILLREKRAVSVINLDQLWSVPYDSEREAALQETFQDALKVVG